MAKFSSFQFLHAVLNGSNSIGTGVQIYASDDDLDQCLYYLRTFSNMLRWSSDGMWAALAENSISTDKGHGSLYHICKIYPTGFEPH